MEINEKSVSEERPSSRKREASLGEAKGKKSNVDARRVPKMTSRFVVATKTAAQ